eukprot:scaffold74604_cov30-Tisochrysis_lutea.AAC.3
MSSSPPRQLREGRPPKQCYGRQQRALAVRLVYVPDDFVSLVSPSVAWLLCLPRGVRSVGAFHGCCVRSSQRLAPLADSCRRTTDARLPLSLPSRSKSQASGACSPE